MKPYTVHGYCTVVDPQWLTLRYSESDLYSNHNATYMLPTAGAIVGLAALGHANVRLLLLPQLEPYMSRLQPLLQQPNRGSTASALADAGADAAGTGTAGTGTSGAGASTPGAAGGGGAGPLRRSEAWRVYGALLDAVSAAMYDRVLSGLVERLPEDQLAAARSVQALLSCCSSRSSLTTLRHLL